MSFLFRPSDENTHAVRKKGRKTDNMVTGPQIKTSEEAGEFAAVSFAS